MSGEPDLPEQLPLGEAPPKAVQGDADQPRYTDRKGPDAMRTIGEVAAALDIRQHVLRYWEEQFPMLRPVKRSGGRRYYRPADVQLLRRIDRLVNHEGYTLRGARMAIEATASGPPAPAAASVAAPISPAPAQPGNAAIAARLRGIRDRLAEALAAG